MAGRAYFPAKRVKTGDIPSNLRRKCSGCGSVKTSGKPAVKLDLTPETRAMFFPGIAQGTQK